MPVLDKPLADLKTYFGINPKPADFDDYWSRAIEELNNTPPEPELIPADALGTRHTETFDLFFNGVGGARIYAKYLRPRQPAKPGPAVLLFHGYTGSSGDWHDKLSFVSEGLCVAALDCRGQAGRSEDAGVVKGNTHHGHIIRGLDDSPEKLLFRQIFLDTVQLARVIASFPESTDLYCMGGSQGGGLAIACAALEPKISRCVSIFPFLSDYQRVWEMDLAKDAYSELRTFLRAIDPLQQRREEIFETLGYIDVHHLAPRIKANVLMALTLMDNICPPSTQFAVYNNLTTEKDAAIYPDFGHEGLPGFQDRAFRFLVQP
ncbi:MAG: alpha/beta fold hydrolase [Terrimicrobiaceae bacterium]